MLREAAKGKINEFYYENPEGKSYSDYEMWQTAVTTKYPQAIIQPELDTDAAVERGEAVGFWDHQTQHGIVYDPNLIKKESLDSFQATNFTPEELQIIKTIMPEAVVDESGLVTFGTFALLKFQSGMIELVIKEGTEYKDFKTFTDINDLQQNLKESLPAEKPLYENFQNDDFNIEGFKENMRGYVNNVENYIDLDEDHNIYYVNIPFTALKTDDVSVANKIVRISEKYPRCISSSVDWEQKEIRFVFSNRPVVKESLYRDMILEFLDKDEMRIRDIVRKSNGDEAKQIQLASNMAKAITDKHKAFNRGTAAVHVLGKNSEIAKIFFRRAGELGYPVEAELAKPKTAKKLPGSKLPFDKQYKKKHSGTQFSSRHHANPILPCGSLNFISGENKYFNMRENGGTIEVWKSDSGTFKAVVTSGNNPLHEIGERAYFDHDQTQRPLFNGIMVDYINVTSMEELIPLYGKSMMCYVYK